MKVMHLLSSLKHDESERGIFAITHALSKAGHESVVVGSATADDELVLRLLRDDTKYYRIPMLKKSWLSLVYVLKLRRLISEYEPDIVHVHSRCYIGQSAHCLMTNNPKSWRPFMVFIH